jgi:hypothetical protein
LHDKEFENNNFHTGWLDARIASKFQAAPELPVHVTVAIGATLGILLVVILQCLTNSF